MQLPQQLLDSLKGIRGFDKEAFEKVHASGEQVTSIRANPTKWSRVNGQWSTEEKIPNSQFPIPNSRIPWAENGFYLTKRPSFTFDPLFHAGCYYVQEASGMFLEQALKQLVNLSQPIKVLDLCAAPGGKSTHIQSLISSGSLLLSNEVIKPRNNILVDNIIKWGCNNVVVTQNDPKELGKLKNYFDVIVADAPCSGSGLFRRDESAMDEWSLNNVQLCCQRQQRILADVWPALKKDGVLVYSTCSYSKEENEDVLDWMMENFEVGSCALTVGNDWGIIEVSSEKHNAFGYRFFPDKVKGEGFFIACFRKLIGNESSPFLGKFLTNKKNKQQKSLTRTEIQLIMKWIENENLSFLTHNNTVIAILEQQVNDIQFLIQHLRVNYFGTILGDIIREKMVPHHALALSFLVSDTIKKIELNYEQAIQYLKKKDLVMHSENKGWQLVTFRDHPLGWINILLNRINNYYPKTLRILKDDDPSSLKGINKL